MPRMRNPHTDAVADVVPERAAVLLSRGWVYADQADAAPPAPEPDLVEEMAAGLAEARDQAAWLVAEARWQTSEALARLADTPGADALEAVSDQLTRAHEKIETLEEAAGQLVQERDELAQTAADLRHGLDESGKSNETVLRERDELAQRVEQLEADLAEATKPDEDAKADPPGPKPAAKTPAGRKPAAK